MKRERTQKGNLKKTKNRNTASGIVQEDHSCTVLLLTGTVVDSEAQFIVKHFNGRTRRHQGTVMDENATIIDEDPHAKKRQQNHDPNRHGVHRR